MDAYQIPNLAKACRMLMWLASERQAYSVTEVARHLQMPRTTAFRVLRTLCAEGLVEENNGRYSVGAGLLRIGLLALQGVELHALARPVLQKLADATGETAHLAVQSGHQMLIVEVADSPNPIRVASRPGTVVTMHCAATGKALLATMPLERARAILSATPLVRRTERSITELAALEAELDLVRARGYALDDEEYHEGVRCLAVVVRDARGEAVGAMGVTAAATRFTKRMIPAMARDVMNAAQTLSTALGWGVADSVSPRSGGNFNMSSDDS